MEKTLIVLTMLVVATIAALLPALAIGFVIWLWAS
jgi:hypothetical protein